MLTLSGMGQAAACGGTRKLRGRFENRPEENNENTTEKYRERGL